VIRNTRRIRILPASHHPLRDLFLIAARARFSMNHPECGPDMSTLRG